MTGFYSTTSPASLTGRIRFFWLLSLLTELPIDDAAESLSPPVLLELMETGYSRSTSPVAPWRHSFTSPASGESSGGHSDRPELQAPSPRRSLPLLQLL